MPLIAPSWNIAKQRISPGAGPQAAQPAAHGRRRHVQAGADPRAARSVQRRGQAGADHLDRVGAPGRAPGRQQDVRAAAGPAAGPVRPQPRGRAAQQPDHPFPAVPPPGQPARAARRAGQQAAGQIGGGGCGIGAQQHGRPSRSRRPRCPGQGTARQGELVLQPARPGGVPQPRPPRTSANDTVNTGGNPGTASASTSCRMLTVSSRTKTDTGRRTRIGMLTLDGARPLSRAQKERRGTTRPDRRFPFTLG